MSQKLKIENLKVVSFVTKAEQLEMQGGVISFNECSAFTCEPVTCLPACSETNGRNYCKEPDLS